MPDDTDHDLSPEGPILSNIHPGRGRVRRILMRPGRAPQVWIDMPAAWRRPNFSPAEIACRGTGRLLVSEAALDKLQALRDALAKPLIIRSAYRSPEHNRAVGGAQALKHMEGVAFDVAMTDHDPETSEAAARAVGFQGFGFYPRSGFMHIDLGPARRWGEQFPKRAIAFAAETPPAREVLAETGRSIMIFRQAS